jgi:gluconokinase
MMADVVGRKIELAPIVEASSRGAALLALEAAGKIDSIETVDFEISVAPVIYEPDLNRHARYTEAIARQEKLYQKLMQ